MGLFGRKRDAATVGPDLRAGLALPVGSSVSAKDLEDWLHSWSGTTVGSPLPASLTWTGPVAADPEAGEPAGAWVYTLSWDPAAVTTPASTLGDAPIASDIEAAVDLLQWLVDLGGRRDGSATARRQAYAEAAVSGLARRTHGLVRFPGTDWAPPADPEATTSVYLDRRPEAAEVLAALTDLLPGLVEADLGPGTWVLDAPDGRGLWLDELEFDEATGPVDPLTVALCAMATQHANPMWVVRIEGVVDTADAVARADLEAIARTCAGAIGGLAVDTDGFPL
jgi:hypothetical protein